MRYLHIVLACTVALAGCTGDGPPESKGPVSGLGIKALGSDVLHAGDFFSYEGESGALQLRVDGLHDLRDEAHHIVTAIPITSEWTPRGSRTVVKTAFVGIESREVVALLGECPMLRNPDGSTTCFDVRNLMYDVSPTTFPFRDLLGLTEGATSLQTRLTTGGGTAVFNHVLQPAPEAGSNCTKMKPEPFTGPSVGRSAIPFVGEGIAYIFCGQAQPPQAIIEPSGATLRLKEYRSGTESIQWANSSKAAAPPSLSSARLDATPPESEQGVGAFGIREAYEYAKTNDPAFARFLSDHPDAIFRESRQPGHNRLESPPIPMAPQAVKGTGQTRTLAFGSPGASEYHEVQVQKQTIEGAPPLYQVLRSELQTDPVANPRSLEGAHVTLDAAKAEADHILSTVFSWTEAEAKYQDAAGTKRSLEDRLHYKFVYEGTGVGEGATSIEFKYSVRIDSRTGALVRINAPLAALAWPTPEGQRPQ